MGVGKRAPERSASRVTGAAYCHDERCATVNVSAWGFAGGRPRGGRRLYRDNHTASIFNPLTRCLSALLIDGDHVEEQRTLMESGSIKNHGATFTHNKSIGTCRTESREETLVFGFISGRR